MWKAVLTLKTPGKVSNSIWFLIWIQTWTFHSGPLLMQSYGLWGAGLLHPTVPSRRPAAHLWLREPLWGHQLVTLTHGWCDPSWTDRSSIFLCVLELDSALLTITQINRHYNIWQHIMWKKIGPSKLSNKPLLYSERFWTAVWLFLPSWESLALWMTEAISWLREATSLRSSWFSSRRLESTWLWDSSTRRLEDTWLWDSSIGAAEGSRGVGSWGTASPESELSGVSIGKKKCPFWNELMFILHRHLFPSQGFYSSSCRTLLSWNVG